MSEQNYVELYSDTSDEDLMPQRDKFGSVIDFGDSEDEEAPFYPPSSVEDLSRAKHQVDMLYLPLPGGGRQPVHASVLFGSKQFPLLIPGVPRDEAGHNKIMMKEYYKHLRQTECKPCYKQPSTIYRTYENRTDRIEIIHKIVEVCDVLKEHDKVLHLAITVYDFVCSCYYGDDNKKMCIAAASIFVSSKFNNDKPVCMHSLLAAFGNIFCKHSLVELEEMVLKKLAWHLNFPTAYLFLEYFCHDDDDKVVFYAAQYFIEISYMHIKTLKYYRSKLAAAALALAKIMLGASSWSPADRRLTGYGSKRLAAPFNALLRYAKRYCFDENGACILNKKFSRGEYLYPHFFKSGLLKIKEIPEN